MRRHHSGGRSRTGRLLLPILILFVSGLAGDALANSRARSAAVRRVMSRPMERRASGVLVPRSPAFEAQQRKLRRFFGYRNAAKAYLKASGARPAPAFHQQFVAQAMARAERVLNRRNLTASNLEVLVLDEGAADGLNAASWAGQLLTINRDIIDMSFHIASAVTSAQSEVDVDKNLYKLALWERGATEMPRFTVRDKARRNTVAEGIFMGVLLHEIGHAFRHSPAVIERDPPLWVPGREEMGESGAASRRQEREADAISLDLGLAGGSPDPAAFTLFFKYLNVARNVSGPRRKAILLGDNQTHPSDLERIRNANRTLKRAGLRNPYEPKPGEIWLPPSREGLILPAGVGASQ